MLQACPRSGSSADMVRPPPIAAESAVQAVNLLASKVNVQPEELEKIKEQSKEQVGQELVTKI